MVFLCPCGDRPHETKPLIALFTYYNESETYGLEVSMVPLPASATRIIGGFPRPRGDGPVGLLQWLGDAEVSPPARGWSRVPRHRRMDERGSPPARGWSPDTGHDIGHVEGFPARAGMVPRSVPRSGRCQWFPRQ